MAQMWASLQKLAALPRQTQVFCAHDYTAANAAFATPIDPDNPHLQQRIAEITALRAQNQPTVPTEIGRELDTNPFLRPDDANIRQHLNMIDASDAEVFAEIRARKDSF